MRKQFFNIAPNLEETEKILSWEVIFDSCSKEEKTQFVYKSETDLIPLLLYCLNAKSVLDGSNLQFL